MMKVSLTGGDILIDVLPVSLDQLFSMTPIDRPDYDFRPFGPIMIVAISTTVWPIYIGGHWVKGTLGKIL